MHEPSNALILFVVLTVLLFMGLGIAMVILMDHKHRIPGGFTSNPFSLVGIHRDHPVISFLTAIIVLSIIAALVFEITVTLGERLGLFAREEDKSELLQELDEQRFTERMRHFHNEPEQDHADLGRKQACFYCHGDYPHSKKQMVRTLLNMHTQFIGCLTCHVDEKEIPEESYRFRWLNYSGIKVTGPPYGTSHDPDTGYLVNTDDYYSKIVVYQGEGETASLLELTEDKPEVQEFAELVAEGELSDQDREGLKRRFHTMIRDKGRNCSLCHAPEDRAYLPFRQLGFSDQRVTELSNLDIIGVVDKYVEFHLPDLMKNGAPPASEPMPSSSTEQRVPAADQPVNTQSVPSKQPHG